MTKRGPEDEKTTVVGTGRKWQAADLSGTHSSQATPSRSTQIDEKTTFVGEVPTEALSEHSPLPASDGQLRSAPKPRLSWPARDQNFVGDVKTGGAVPRQSAAAEDERTRLYNPNASRPDAPKLPEATAPSASSASADRSSNDPVVGWLVVVDGPGKGRSIEIGIGANPIGRDKGQKLRLDFGDQHISREKHAILIFDPRSRKFFIQSGDVRNLTYVNDELVLSPKELVGSESILVGETKVRFIPLCGADFSWS